MLVNVLSYEVGLPDGSLIEVDGYDEVVEVISQYNESYDLVDGEICFPDLFDFLNMMFTNSTNSTNSKMEVVVNDVVLGTISKVIKKEEI